MRKLDEVILKNTVKHKAKHNAKFSALIILSLLATGCGKPAVQDSVAELRIKNAAQYAIRESYQANTMTKATALLTPITHADGTIWAKLSS